mgnify:CR=1 FL=1
MPFSIRKRITNKNIIPNIKPEEPIETIQIERELVLVDSSPKNVYDKFRNRKEWKEQQRQFALNKKRKKDFFWNVKPKH